MLSRRIGLVEGRGGPGPLVVIVGGIHGNEHAGATAAGRFLCDLEACRDVLRGTVLALTGNRAALERRVRFVERDLNRGWDDETVGGLLAAPAGSLCHEDLEQRELLEVILPLTRSTTGKVTFLDLHSTSSESPPFVCFGDTLQNRDLALSLGLPAILGLEEVIHGAMLGYFADHGHVAVAVEAGQHDAPETAELHLAALWVATIALGLLRPGDVPRLDARRRQLELARGGAPRVLEIRHRHVVAPDDDFVMEPGFRSFQPVERGQLLARDRRGPIRSREAAILLMPRYQRQGEDGFFLARRVAPAWLGISRWLREARADRVVPFLPGLRMEPGGRVVRTGRVPLPYVTELMHLLGYRRRARGGLGFARRADRGEE